MKKTLTAIILSLAAAATLSLGMAACGNPDDGTPAGATNGLEYTLSDDGTYYTLAGIGTATETEIIIPETYRDLPVTEIEADAFRSNKDITAVTIPASITTIGPAVFNDCSSLESVTFEGDELDSLGNFAFINCTSLTEIALPEGIPTIGTYTFSGCSNLTAITIPASVTSIEASAFTLCYRLATINYRGSRTQWYGIEIGDQNEAVYEAEINYGS